MFKGSFTTADGVVHRMHGPTKWTEMSTRTYMRLMNEWTDRDDLTRMLAIVYNIDYDILNKSNPLLMKPLARACRFLVTDTMDLKSLPKPSTINIGAQKIDVPVKIGTEAFGKAIILKSMIGKTFEENIAKLAAIWLTPIPFSMTAARKLEEQIMELPITDVYPISFFCVSTLTLPGSVLMKGLLLLRASGKRIGNTLVDLRTQVNSTPTSTLSALMQRSSRLIQMLSMLRKHLTQ